jgi:tetratricopeptide (TPR) repeat protein
MKSKGAFMLFRPLAIAIAAGLSVGLVFGQTGNPMVDSSKTSAPAVPQADQSTDVKPQITPELRGDLFMVRKQYREAVEAFHEGSLKDPVLWNKTGIAFHQMAQLDNALKSYQQAVRLKHDYVEAINNIGTIYYARKNYRRSITYYQRAIQIAPKAARSGSIYSNLGTAYFARKQYKEAAAAFQTAMELDPEVFEHRSSYGILLEERNVEERAKFHYYVAKLYAKNGRNDLALQYLRKALEEGFKERKQLEKDPEFAALRDLKEFQDLLALEPRVL